VEKLLDQATASLHPDKKLPRRRGGHRVNPNPTLI
jgi:hypothetical protein